MLSAVALSFSNLFIFLGEKIAECSHIHAFGHDHAVDLQNVLLAVIRLDESVMTVWAQMGALPGVRHAVMLQSGRICQFQLAQITLHSLFSMSLHVGFNFLFSFKSLSALFAYPGAGV